MAGHELAGILLAELALDPRIRTGRPPPRRATGATTTSARPSVTGSPSNAAATSPSDDAPDQPADRAGPGLVGRDSRPQLRPADQRGRRRTRRYRSPQTTTNSSSTVAASRRTGRIADQQESRGRTARRRRRRPAERSLRWRRTQRRWRSQQHKAGQAEAVRRRSPRLAGSERVTATSAAQMTSRSCSRSPVGATSP